MLLREVREGRGTLQPYGVEGFLPQGWAVRSAWCGSESRSTVGGHL